MGKDKISVNAVLDEDIEKLLKATSYYEDFISGKFKCQNCGQIITSKNVSVILPQVKDNELVSLLFYCENIECTEKYNNKQW